MTGLANQGEGIQIERIASGPNRQVRHRPAGQAGGVPRGHRARTGDGQFAINQQPSTINQRPLLSYHMEQFVRSGHLLDQRNPMPDLKGAAGTPALALDCPGERVDH